MALDGGIMSRETVGRSCGFLGSLSASLHREGYLDVAIILGLYVTLNLSR